MSKPSESADKSDKTEKAEEKAKTRGANDDDLRSMPKPATAAAGKAKRRREPEGIFVTHLGPLKLMCDGAARDIMPDEQIPPDTWGALSEAKRAEYLETGIAEER